jgi:hypothetical protein
MRQNHESITIGEAVAMVIRQDCEAPREVLAKKIGQALGVSVEIENDRQERC